MRNFKNLTIKTKGMKENYMWVHSGNGYGSFNDDRAFDRYVVGVASTLAVTRMEYQFRDALQEVLQHGHPPSSPRRIPGRARFMTELLAVVRGGYLPASIPERFHACYIASLGVTLEAYINI